VCPNSRAHLREYTQLAPHCQIRRSTVGYSGWGDVTSAQARCMALRRPFHWLWVGSLSTQAHLFHELAESLVSSGYVGHFG